MKAIICFWSGTVHIDSFTEQWTACQCGNVRARWLDPHAGTVAVAARDRESVRLLGLNNHLLMPALQASRWRDEGHPRGQSWDEFRELHDRATDAPNHVFDKSRAGCWAVIVRIGATSDVRWATDEEYLEAFP